MSAYVDVHTHLTHEMFRDDLPEVVVRANDAGLGAIVVNGLEPKSNREILKLADTYQIVKAALGIYPVDAVHELLPDEFPHQVEAFNIEEEIEFIARQAESGRLIAIGECGLDGHWLEEASFAAQERVLESLVDIAIKNGLPVIIHSRKQEKRTFELLKHLGAKKVDFHCYSGRSKWAIEAARTEDQWYFSIPANARVNQLFTKLLKELPEEKVLTETDAPYLGPARNTRNEPANVVNTVQLFAELKSWDVEQAKQRVWDNYRKLFGA